MNRQIFLITFFSILLALTIIADARWNNMFYNFVVLANQFPISNATTPQECCNACVNNPSCLQWGMDGRGNCFNYMDTTNLPSICESTTTPEVNSGNIRCGGNQCQTS
ncbi:20134_t:CDS:2 [Dentiscutata erythropus]|uniref:20134_t:CDS:1 n=1 Tax=Dentiscutata erythropus TaxID=1348616 RepID=A0A9N8V5U3_9GLOM|nr:20134_t:CDS:2 [Dentiscutata erythropus]